MPGQIDSNYKHWNEVEEKLRKIEDMKLAGIKQEESKIMDKSTSSKNFKHQKGSPRKTVYEKLLLP
jgi:hypothetical protein